MNSAYTIYDHEGLRSGNVLNNGYVKLQSICIFCEVYPERSLKVQDINIIAKYIIKSLVSRSQFGLIKVSLKQRYTSLQKHDNLNIEIRL